MLVVQWGKFSLLVLDLGRDVLVGSNSVHSLLEPPLELTLERLYLLLE